MTLHTLCQADSVEQLLAASGIAASSTRVTWVRNNLPESLVAAIEFAVDGTTYRGYLRAHEGDRAPTLVEKWRHLRRVDNEIGDGVRLLADRRVALFSFPNDAGLRDLRWVADVKKLKRTLSTAARFRAAGLRVSGKQSQFTLVRYKPERRYIVRATLALRDASNRGDESLDAFLRFFPDDRGARTALVTQTLRQGGAADHVPEPLGTFMDDRLYVETAVPGESLRDAIRSGTADAHAVADCISALHRVDLDTAPRRSSESLLEDLRRKLPHLGAAAASVVDRLAAGVPDASARAGIVHGDLHPGQFIVDGARIRVVDWERAGRGDPWLDVGRFAAEVDALGLEAPGDAARMAAFADAVVDRYCDVSGEGTARLAFYRAVALLGLAAIPHRRGLTDAADRAAPLITLAERAAATAAPSWRILYPRARGRWSARTADGHATFDPTRGALTPIDPAEDAHLPDLAAALSGGTLASYRAGRRAMVRADDTTWLKVLPAKKAARLRAKLSVLADSCERRPAPFPLLPRLREPLARSHDGRIPLKSIPGRSLRRALRDRTELAATIDRVAAGLATFHATPADPRLPAVAWPVLQDWLAHADTVGRDFARRVRTLYHARPETFAATVPTADTLAHGDLHDDNILLGPDRIALLDVDGLGRGSAGEDLGNLAAHFSLAAFRNRLDRTAAERDCDALLHAYIDAGGAVAASRFRPACARALLRIAVVYALRSEHRGIADRLLAEAAHWSDA